MTVWASHAVVPNQRERGNRIAAQPALAPSPTPGQNNPGMKAKMNVIWHADFIVLELPVPWLGCQNSCILNQ
jgi:hypothetical protein